MGWGGILPPAETPPSPRPLPLPAERSTWYQRRGDRGRTFGDKYRRTPLRTRNITPARLFTNSWYRVRRRLGGLGKRPCSSASCYSSPKPYRSTTSSSQRTCGGEPDSSSSHRSRQLCYHFSG